MMNAPANTVAGILALNYGREYVTGRDLEVAEEIVEALGWRTIDTAPRDGTVIDLWHDEFGRHADCYWGNTQHSCGEAGRYCDSDWHSEEPGWVHADLNEILFTGDGEFTHWMPRPVGPKAADEDRTRLRGGTS